MRGHRSWGAVAAAWCALVVPACGPKNFDNENDALRREREVLRDRIAALELELAEARAKIPATDSPEADAIARATPEAAKVTIARLARLEDADGDGIADRVTLRIEPVDGRGRFVQVAGRIEARVEAVRADAPTREVGRAMLDPEQVRDAFRAGFGGAVYAVEVPVDGAGLREGDRLMATVSVTVGAGQTLEDVRVLDGVVERWMKFRASR